MSEGKKKLLISFSGGETSAFMAQWLWKFKQDEYEMIFVFANTGQENEETLQFVKRCSDYFGFPVFWVEAKVYHNERRSTGFSITDFHNADREGKVFEEVIKKYGIPNMATPHCTRELKQNPIKAYAKSIGWKNYYLAIGIRSDEIDRMNAKWKENRFYYPLISERPMNKAKINFFWKQQPFRLELKGYQGNCLTCWKKGDNKLYQIAKENEGAFNFFGKMELRYDKYVREEVLKRMAERGEYPTLPVRFFRKNRSVQDIINESKQFNNRTIDDSKIYEMQQDIFDYIDLVGGESCEVFSDCGS
jgi:hypothetical protein